VAARPLEESGDVVRFEDAEFEGIGERRGMTITSHDVILRPRRDGS
jgi:hypothetical protein